MSKKFQQDLSDHRKVYQKKQLLASEVSDNPMEVFRDWYLEAEEHISGEANAFTLATTGTDLKVSSRVVLLKKYTWEGFIFYTNYQSQKGQDIAQNPQVSASFFWPEMERQIIIKGKAVMIAPNLSDGYFESRPRGSRLGAIASDQSKPIASREALDEKLKDLENAYIGKEIPRPDYWGGYMIKPSEIEFWQGRPNRMHDRLRYTLQADYSWLLERLQP